MRDVDSFGKICFKVSLLGWLHMQDENTEHGEPGGFGDHNCSYLLGSLSSSLLSPTWPLLATVGLHVTGHPLVDVLQLFITSLVDGSPSDGNSPATRGRNSA